MNKNTVPGETRSAMVTSGIRIGSPALTTRGLIEKDMTGLAQALSSCLKDEPGWLDSGRAFVKSICNAYPLYDGLLGQKGYHEAPSS